MKIFVPLCMMMLTAAACAKEQTAAEKTPPAKQAAAERKPENATKKKAETNPATTPVPVNRSQQRDVWMKRHEALKRRARKGPLDLVFLGDSITVGWEHAGKDVWKKWYGDRKAAPFGINGDATQHLLWRLQNGELGDAKPKLAVIQIGTNNNWASGKPNTAEQVLAGVTAVVDTLHESSPETTILLLAIFPRAKSPAHGAHRNNLKANELLASLGEREYVVWRDINDVFIEEGEKHITEKLFPDYLHPNAAGFERWAEAIEPVVEAVLGEKEDTKAE